MWTFCLAFRAMGASVRKRHRLVSLRFLQIIKECRVALRPTSAIRQRIFSVANPPFSRLKGQLHRNRQPIGWLLDKG